jgi:anti-anti-sigma factor
MSAQPNEFTIQFDPSSDGVLIVRVAGRLRDTPDLSLEGALGSQVGAPPLVVIYLDGVEYISSSGIGSLTRLFGEIHGADGRMAIAGPSVHVSDLLHLAGINQLVDITDSLAEAINLLKAAESAAEGSA